ncbi:MAG: hypothetical protein U9N52_01960, partial [Campylobacterota bacterium]|nr:hypothetical protein [Campylobacterota bacterium]
MKRLFLLLALVGVATVVSASHMAKKITIQGYVNEKKAIKLKSKLAKDYYIKTVSKDYDLKLDIE